MIISDNLTHPWRQRPFFLAMVFSLAVHVVLLLGLLIQRHLPKMEPWLSPMRVEFLNQTLAPTAPPKEAEALAEANQQAQSQRNDLVTTPNTSDTLPVPLTAPPADTQEQNGKIAEPTETSPEPPVNTSPLRATPSEKKPPLHAEREHPIVQKRPQRQQQSNDSSNAQSFPLKLTPSLGELAEWDRRQELERFKNQENKGEATVDLNTRETRYAAYFNGIKQRIRQFLPENTHMVGTLSLEFTVDQDGHLLEVEVVHATGQAALDDAVVAAVKKAAPFPPLPASWRLKKLHLNFNIEYFMRKVKWGG